MVPVSCILCTPESKYSPFTFVNAVLIPHIRARSRVHFHIEYPQAVRQTCSELGEGNTSAFCTSTVATKCSTAHQSPLAERLSKSSENSLMLLAVVTPTGSASITGVNLKSRGRN